MSKSKRNDEISSKTSMKPDLVNDASYYDSVRMEKIRSHLTDLRRSMLMVPKKQLRIDANTHLEAMESAYTDGLLYPQNAKTLSSEALSLRNMAILGLKKNRGIFPDSETRESLKSIEDAAERVIELSKPPMTGSKSSARISLQDSQSRQADNAIGHKLLNLATTVLETYADTQETVTVKEVDQVIGDAVATATSLNSLVDATVPECVDDTFDDKIFTKIASLDRARKWAIPKDKQVYSDNYSRLLEHISYLYRGDPPSSSPSPDPNKADGQRIASMVETVAETAHFALYKLGEVGEIARTLQKELDRRDRDDAAMSKAVDRTVSRND